MKKKTHLSLALVALMAIGGSGWLAGCGGGSGGAFVTTKTVQAAQSTAVGNGSARGFVTLRGTVPVSLGFTLTPGALTGLPTGAAPSQFFVTLPAEASQYTPIQVLGVAYFNASTSTTLGNVPAHFNPVFLLNQPQASDPPDFAKEQTPVAAKELAKDHVYINNFVPGLGAEYDDPSQPQRQPNWNSTGQNYFYYSGHLNGYGLGATIPFLQSKATRSDAIKQPELYPKAGYYAFGHKVSYDSTTNLYTVELTDFRYENASHSVAGN